MKLIILGSGTTDPTSGRNEPGYLLEIGKDLVLIDAGSGTKEHIQDSGYDYLKINHILISHTHVDHVADLPALFWGWWVRAGTAYAPGAVKKDVVILGPKGMKKFIKKMGEAFFPHFENFFTYQVKIKEMHNSVYRPYQGWQTDQSAIRKKRLGKTENWKVKSVYTWKQGHTFSPCALAYRIEHKGKSLVYGADMCYDYPKSLIDILKNADLLLIESGFPEKKKTPGHLTPGRAAQIAQEARVKKLVLTHFYPPCEKYDLKKQARKYYKGPIVLAKDLMKIKI